MSLFLSMFPIYLLGNLHCLGMCGPLVVFLGKHRYRYFYFVGRILSFSLAGLVAGEIGAVLQIWLKEYHLSSLVSVGFGLLMLVAGLSVALGKGIPGNQWFGKKLSPVNNRLSLLLLKDVPFATFLFGFATVLLPCGQTLLVFSACALSQSAGVGIVNGFAFALLTTPSLWLAMHASHVLNRWQFLGNRVLGGCAVLVGLFAILRGMADFEWIPHLMLNEHFHIALY